MNCFSCGKDIPFDGRVGKRETCPHCDADAHVCLNCEFYDRNAHNECRETQAERVRLKDRNNYCDYFTPSTKAGGKTSGAGKDGARKAFEDLFG